MTQRSMSTTRTTLRTRTEQENIDCGTKFDRAGLTPETQVVGEDKEWLASLRFGIFFDAIFRLA